jgi:hypothetical protein
MRAVACLVVMLSNADAAPLSPDGLGDLRQQGEDGYKRCFSQRAPQQPSFAEATGQAQELLAAAMGR